MMTPAIQCADCKRWVPSEMVAKEVPGHDCTYRPEPRPAYPSTIEATLERIEDKLDWLITLTSLNAS